MATVVICDSALGCCRCRTWVECLQDGELDGDAVSAKGVSDRQAAVAFAGLVHPAGGMYLSSSTGSSRLSNRPAGMRSVPGIYMTAGASVTLAWPGRRGHWHGLVFVHKRYGMFCPISPGQRLLPQSQGCGVPSTRGAGGGREMRKLRDEVECETRAVTRAARGEGKPQAAGCSGSAASSSAHQLPRRQPQAVQTLRGHPGFVLSLVTSADASPATCRHGTAPLGLAAPAGRGSRKQNLKTSL